MERLSEASDIAKRLSDNVKSVVIGKDSAIELGLVCLFANGHLLIEDVPGLGKTTLAKSIAISSGCSFKRIQFVPDILPSDITGGNMYNQKTGEFEFRPGPLMAQVVLADEINRAPSKTQAALLESMEERKLTVDGITYDLGKPFFIVATLNPVEYHGIFPLPEAELDRFAVRVSLGYADIEHEMAILSSQEKQSPIDSLSSVTNPEEIIMVQQEVTGIYVDPLVARYIVALAQATRQHKDIILGASHRGSLALFRCTQALALMRGREFVVPDDVKELAVAVLAHRLIISSDGRARGIDGAKAISSIVDDTDIPGAGL